MALFLDRHVVGEVTPEALAAAHVQDLEVQDRHGVKYHTYWFDQAAGSVFCLAEGPSRDAVDQVHRDSHGLAADQIIELGSLTSLNQFMGAPPAHPPGEAYVESAMRAILFTDICGSVEQTARLGDDGHVAVLDVHDEIVRSALGAHSGREVKHTGDGIMASFASSVAAVEFARAVVADVRRASQESEPFAVSIGISAGEPISRGTDDLFGAAVQLAARLCSAASEFQIIVSSAIKDLCVGKKIDFADLGVLSLKGLDEPQHAFAVVA